MHRLHPVAAALAIALGGAVAHAAAPPEPAIPVVPMDDGQAVRRVVEVRPFTLAEGALTYDFRAGAPAIRAGQLVVVRVDPDYLKAVQVKSPVLYAGAVPVQVIEKDRVAGCVAGVIPGDVDARIEPFFYGSYELPERVDARRGAAERLAAIDAGLGPRPAAEAAAWTASPLALRDPAALAQSLHAALLRCTQSHP